MENTLLGLSEVAKILGCRLWDITNAHTWGKIPTPRVIAGRRIYGPADVERLRQWFATGRRPYRKRDMAFWNK